MITKDLVTAINAVVEFPAGEHVNNQIFAALVEDLVAHVVYGVRTIGLVVW